MNSHDSATGAIVRIRRLSLRPYLQGYIQGYKDSDRSTPPEDKVTRRSRTCTGHTPPAHKVTNSMTASGMHDDHVGPRGHPAWGGKRHCWEEQAALALTARAVASARGSPAYIAMIALA